MRAIICGGRDFTDWEWFAARMSVVHKLIHITGVIEGGAKGVDRMARFWASLADIPVQTVAADWEARGKKAGYLRNVAMADMEPDVVIAGPGGKGTRMMLDIAKQRSIKVILLEKVQCEITPNPRLAPPPYLREPALERSVTTA